MCGVHVTAPRGGRQAGQWIIGTALGLYFTPAVVAHVGGIAWLLVVGALFAIGLGYVCGYALSALAGTDRTTALFASVPGGVAEMAVTAKVLELGVPLVTSFHVTRVVLLLLCTGPLFRWLAQWRNR